MKIAAEGAALDGDPFLCTAIEEAKKSLGHGGIPIGAVLVRQNKIIGRGHDRRVQRRDPLALAEIDCLANAGQQKSYSDTVLYATLMPSFVSAGAILQFGVPRLVVADTVNFAGGACKIAGGAKLLADCGVELIDLHDAQCIEMMAKFIREKGRFGTSTSGNADRIRVQYGECCKPSCRAAAHRGRHRPGSEVGQDAESRHRAGGCRARA